MPHVYHAFNYDTWCFYLLQTSGVYNANTHAHARACVDDIHAIETFSQLDILVQVCCIISRYWGKKVHEENIVSTLNTSDDVTMKKSVMKK